MARAQSVGEASVILLRRRYAHRILLCPPWTSSVAWPFGMPRTVDVNAGFFL